MKLISYAQNFEDVMLWRALKHVPKGSYIDIGAQDPRIDSVSRLFYEHEWRGIHVEPLRIYCDALLADRPDEVVLQAAVAAQSGVIQLFEIPNTGISTARADIAELHRNRGFSINEITVPSITLKHVFDYADRTDIHWLKIDVEGLEEQVLRSWGDSPARPWIVVIESTLPMTQIQSYEPWEQELSKRGYVFSYFDGLNRFYLAEGHAALAAAFTAGPNVFDGFSLSGLASTTYCSEVRMQYEAALDFSAKRFEAYCANQRVQIAEAEHSRNELVIKHSALEELNNKYSQQLAADLQQKHDQTEALERLQQQQLHDEQGHEKQAVQFKLIRRGYEFQIEAASKREHALQIKLETVLRETVVFTQNMTEAILLGLEETARQTELLRREYHSLQSSHSTQKKVVSPRITSVNEQGTLQQHATDEHSAAPISALNKYWLMRQMLICPLGACLDESFNDRGQLRAAGDRLQRGLGAEGTAAYLALVSHLTHATLSWQLTLPFRAIEAIFVKKDASKF